MQGKGPRIERETIIRFDEASSTAEIWTASERFYRKLRKQELVPKEDSERWATFEVPKRSVVIKTRRVLTPKQREALRKHRFSSRKTAIIAGDNDQKDRSCWVPLSGLRGGSFTRDHRGEDGTMRRPRPTGRTSPNFGGSQPRTTAKAPKGG